jgi:hypothetical protein
MGKRKTKKCKQIQNLNMETVEESVIQNVDKGIAGYLKFCVTKRFSFHSFCSYLVSYMRRVAVLPVVR